jgi:hypothetical protein
LQSGCKGSICGHSASALGNLVSMPIAALGLSGHCNGYRATVAVICNTKNTEPDHSVGSSYYLKMKTGKKTGLYYPELLDCSLVQSEKKLDWTVWSGLRLDRSYTYCTAIGGTAVSLYITNRQQKTGFTWAAYWAALCIL